MSRPTLQHITADDAKGAALHAAQLGVAEELWALQHVVDELRAALALHIASAVRALVSSHSQPQ
jgi:hypothetical protein